METYRANGVEITQQSIPTKTMVELFELLDRLKNVANVSFNRVNFIRSMGEIQEFIDKLESDSE